MPHALIPAALAALAVPLAAVPLAATPDSAGLDGLQVAQVTIHERIILRVPRMPARAAPAQEWREHKGPKCVAAASLAGALVSGNETVDLVLVGGKRLRAKLDGDCEPVDFQSGFYIRPAADGMICADRDVIRARSGASCAIDVFKTLKQSR